MKKYILIAIIFLVAWGYYQKNLRQGPSSALENHGLDDKSTQMDQTPTVHMESRFKCDGRQYCSQMNSRAEAEFFLNNCPNTKMDGDHDGVPCENDSRF